MAKKKSGNSECIRFSLPQPHHPSTQPKTGTNSRQSDKSGQVNAEPSASTPTASTILKVTNEGGVVTLTMNRPDRLDAISPDFVADFVAAPDESEAKAVAAEISANNEYGGMTKSRSECRHPNWKLY